MAGILEKIRVAVLSNVHILLDKVIDLNSVEALKVYARDLEEARNDMREAAAAEEGNKRVLIKEIQELNTKISTTEKNIKLILSDESEENDHFATKLATQLVGYKNSLKAKTEELEATEKNAAALDKSLSTVENRLTEMVNRLDYLESLERTTKAKEKAAEAVEKASEVVGAGAGVKVDDIERKLEKKAATAGVKLERAMGNIEDAGTSAEAAAEIARIKQEMEKGKKEAKGTQPS